ncbi:hypothetical protein KPL52_03085 [Clostridium tagluense]|nr:hypothetical protein [Clostridium tagluense]MBU3126655.1 hypothetical protein [Clostridium tagluense]
MSYISKEILKHYINEQKFTSENEVLNAMKACSEMDLQLGYDKYAISEKQTINSRNDYSKKNCEI